MIMKKSIFGSLLLLFPSCNAFSGTKLPKSFRSKTEESSAAVRPGDGIRLFATSQVPTKSPSMVEADTDGSKIVGNVLFLLPHNAAAVVSKFGTRSPYGSPSILEATEQLQRKVGWFSDHLVDAEIVVLPENGDYTEIQARALKANALFALHLNDNESKWLETVFDSRNQRDRQDMCNFALECDGSLPSICGPYYSASPSLSSQLLPWTDSASGKRLDEKMKGLFDRWTSDEFTYAIMLFFNRFSGTKIDWCKHSIDASWEKGPVQNAQELYSMVTKCGDCVAKCVKDEKCKECLDALADIDTTDQVLSYRTIVSYESELLKDFSYCILQKNNM
jgi:hypothetical protein